MCCADLNPDEIEKPTEMLYSVFTYTSQVFTAKGEV